MNYLLDTNILIYHTSGSQVTAGFIEDLITQKALNISILTKIEFLGWDKHTPEGFEKCKTFNVDDFKEIEGLQIFNPFE